MKDNLLRYTLRVDRELFGKFRYIAESKGRSANKEIEQYLKKCVAKYEADFGEIKIDECPKNFIKKTMRTPFGAVA